MMANSNSEMPMFAMKTNEEDYIFVKRNKQVHQYAVSKKFTLDNPQKNELYEVMQVMKRIANLFM